MLVAALVTTSAAIANLEREDDKELAQLQAVNFANQINNMPVPRDFEALASVANLVKSSRPSIVSVRIWDRSGGEFLARVSAAGSSAIEEIPDETKEALRSGVISKVVNTNPYGSNGSLYRVFVPISAGGRLSGAVELSERFDSIATVALRYARKTLWMSLIAILLIMVGNYFLFRQLVYIPIERLLSAMSRAKSGNLEETVPARSPDEIGILSNEFNSMIRKVKEMTQAREAQQTILEQRIHEATAELEERNRQLKETNLELWRTTRRMNELGRLAAAGQTAVQFAHEVGTPLNLISGHVQLLQSDLLRDPGDAEARISTITAQIERIERIVRGMLDRTRFEIELIPMNINHLLSRLFDATSPALDKRGVRLIEKLDPELPRIDGSPDRLQQLFLNLINNALDAMPQNGELTVSTRVQADDGGKSRKVVVDFADNGSGMTPEILAHIFDPLYSTKERGHGTGLGLVIVSQVMQEHGGTVEVESNPSQGTRFRLTFPVSHVKQRSDNEEVSLVTTN